MVGWRGVRLDARTADMMDEVVNIVPHINVHPTQGSYSQAVGASAGTHAGGGAIDVAALLMSVEDRQGLVWAMRRVGFAAWLRTPGQSDWPYHVHAVAVGCGDLSRTAALQVEDYLAGLNGLAMRGPDDGPREFVGITWEDYKEDPLFTDADADKIGRAVAKHVWKDDIVPSPSGKDSPNPTWMAGSYLKQILARLERIEEELKKE